MNSNLKAHFCLSAGGGSPARTAKSLDQRLRLETQRAGGFTDLKSRFEGSQRGHQGIPFKTKPKTY